MTDFYANNADIYAAVSLPSLPGQLAALRSIVSEPFPGAVVEVAAGLGTALTTLADMTSDAIYAVEPSTYMRVGLMTTVAGDEALRKRVTIVPGTLRQVGDRLPEQLGGIVVLSALGHFEPAELAQFWQFAAQRLVPGGQLVLRLQPPFEPVEIPWTDFGESRIGTLTYRTAGTASVTSEDLAKWTVRWTIHDADGVELERREASTQWAVVGPGQVTKAATAVGLEASGHDVDWHMLCFRQPR
ncbi:MAG: class I SAM-dependent methyltransferase [Myxococcota bacterium]